MLTIIDLFILFYNANLLGKKGHTSTRECNAFLAFLFLPGFVLIDVYIIVKLFKLS